MGERTWKHKIGARVRSARKAPWTGTVIYHLPQPLDVGWVEYDGSTGRVREVVPWCKRCAQEQRGSRGEAPQRANGGRFHYLNPTCCLVKVTHDRRGRPVRKPWVVVLSEDWLEPVNEAQEAIP